MRKIFLLILILVVLLNSEALEFSFQETDLVEIELEAYDPDGDKLEYMFDSPLNEDGEWQTTYGDAGKYDINVIVTDGENQVKQEITINVAKKEEMPVIDSFLPLEDVVIDENEEIEFEIEVSDLNNDELSYSWSLDDEAVLDTDSYTYDIGYFDAGEHLVKVEVSDGVNEVEKEWNIVVNNIDRKPEFKEPLIDRAVINENDKIEIDFLIEDPDEEEVILLAEELPEGATLEGEKFVWQTNHDSVGKEGIVDNVASKFHLLQESFTIKFIAESNDVSVEKEFVITVKDVNRGPVLDDIEDIIVNGGDVIEINANAVDPDSDKVDYSYSGWMSESKYKTLNGDSGTHIVTVTASDGFLTDSKDVKIIVNKLNSAPSIILGDGISVNEGEMLSFEVKTFDPDGDDVSLEATIPEGAYFSDNMFRWKPGFDLGGIRFNVTFTASDGQVETVKDYIIDVLDSNRAPKINNISPSREITVYQGSEVRFDVFATDLDNDELSYEWPVGLFKSYSGSSAMLRKFTSVGKKEVEVVVSDGEDSISYKWKVNVVKN